ncbi:hypothetical protein BJV82DRAFT_346504 [Fennellomyces sp. T-0311]|nr:hypothetical protein BJV82DRAFT_346504 [Fennellomyces sp. T-0311]
MIGSQLQKNCGSAAFFPRLSFMSSPTQQRSDSQPAINKNPTLTPEGEDSSGDEFPEITEEEIETWSSVERKRFHFKTCAVRDEHLLRQALTVRPFEAKYKKARFDAWQTVAEACDDTIRSLPENATGQLNFYYGKHAKRRFKVLMEAHYGLLNDNKNPMFFGIYGEYGNIQALVERAYELYLLAGYKPGQNAGFFQRKRGKMNGKAGTKRSRQDEQDDDAVDRIRKQLDTQTKKITESLNVQLKSIQTTVARMGEESKWIQSVLEQQQKEHQVTVAKHEKEMQRLVEEQDRRIRAMSDQHARMQVTLREYDAAEQQRKEQWTEMCEQFISMQRQVLGTHREMVEAQSKAEESRMALLRDLFAEKQ